MNDRSVECRTAGTAQLPPSPSLVALSHRQRLTQSDDNHRKPAYKNTVHKRNTNTFTVNQYKAFRKAFHLKSNKLTNTVSMLGQIVQLFENP